jgi:aspartate/methionine/tyrosine aminotransferase
MITRMPGRIERLWMPECTPWLGQSLRSAERELERVAAKASLLDLTTADTRRFPPSDCVLQDFVAAARGSGSAYTPYRGDSGVRAQVAGNVGRFLGIEIDPDRELLITPGTQAGLFLALAALIESGDVAVMIDPDYMFSERMLRFFGATVCHVPLVWEDTVAPGPDLTALEEALRRRPRLLLFSHPNNPTGTVFEPSTVERIAALAQRYGVFVVVDELYSRLVYDRRRFVHLIAAENLKEQCVTVLGPSKTESMSGYRVGVAVGPAWLVDGMEDVLSVMAVRAPAYAQHTLRRWLAEDRTFVDRRVQEYQALRDWTADRLRRSEVVRVVPPHGTAYLFPRVIDTSISDHDLAMYLQREAGVIVSPGYQFGPRGASHFRVCFAQELARLESAIDRMTTALARMVIRGGHRAGSSPPG